METSSALLAPYVENWPVIREFPAQRPVTRRFDVFVFLTVPEETIEKTIKMPVIWGDITLIILIM